MWNHAVTDWAVTFSKEWDMQVEAKGKNLATDQLHQHWITQKNV
jgi:hypothetical protein